MHSEEISIGDRVRVTSHGEPDMRGLAGTIEQVYGDPGYRAVEVRLENGRSELFWYHELERAPSRDGAGEAGIGYSRVW